MQEVARSVVDNGGRGDDGVDQLQSAVDAQVSPVWALPHRLACWHPSTMT